MSERIDSWRDEFNSRADAADANSAAHLEGKGEKLSAEERAKFEEWSAAGLPVGFDENGDGITYVSNADLKQAIFEYEQSKSSNNIHRRQTHESEPVVMRGPNGEIKITRRRTTITSNESREDFIIDTGDHEPSDIDAIVMAMGGLGSGIWNPNQAYYYDEPQPHGGGYEQDYNKPQQIAAPSVPTTPAPSWSETASSLTDEKTEGSTPRSASEDTEELPPVADQPDFAPQRRPASNVDNMRSMLDDDNETVEGEVVKPRRKSKIGRAAAALTLASVMVGSGYVYYNKSYEDIAGESPTKASLLYPAPGVVKDILL